MSCPFTTNAKGAADVGSSFSFASALGGIAQVLSPSTPDETDITPPGNVTNFTAQGAHTQVLLSWTNPTDEDYVRTLIVRKQGSASANPWDGTVIYEGRAQSYTDTDLQNGTTYYYTAYTFDRVPNYSAGVTVQATPQTGVMSVPAGGSRMSAPTTQGMAIALTRTLSTPMRGADVKQLQQFLQSQGLLDQGNDTGYFGLKTYQAVKQFQCTQNIVCQGTSKLTGWGMVGPRTQARINKLGQGLSPSTLPSPSGSDLSVQSLQSQLAALLQQLAVLQGR